MAKKVIFNLLDVVLFVISSNPYAINRMRARKGGYFKGTVIRATHSHVWIKPYNKDFLDRLRNTSFFRQAWKIGDQVITKDDLNKVGYCLGTTDDLSKMNREYLKRAYKVNKVELLEYVVIPKKQVIHYYGANKRYEMSLAKLANSSLVKKQRHNGNKKKAKFNWTYTIK